MIDNNAYMQFSKVNAVEFQSAISNLINNSVESISASGEISIFLKNQNNFLTITILDNGCGMPEDILKKAVAGGMSTKSQGLGLGLSSSISCMKNWGSTCEIHSKVNEGTKIIIQMQISETPHWFPQNIILSQNSILVILDDDQSIHDILCHRLSSLLKPHDHIKIVNFKDPYKFIEFYNHYDKAKMISFLFDYEFIGSNLCEIDIIDKFQLMANSTLITNRFEDNYVREKCKKSGIKVLPKNLAYYIPIDVRVF
jgi:Histidine kinase-, DNA gyrase B-, and HSP90-like ATPase